VVCLAASVSLRGWDERYEDTKGQNCWSAGYLCSAGEEREVYRVVASTVAICSMTDEVVQEAWRRMEVSPKAIYASTRSSLLPDSRVHHRISNPAPI
jgi:hypothetical protein